MLKSDGSTASKIWDTGNSEFYQPSLFNGSFIVNGTTTNIIDLNVYGHLVVAGYMSAKPYISLKVTATGGTASTVSGSTVTIVTPGTVALTQM